MFADLVFDAPLVVGMFVSFDIRIHWADVALLFRVPFLSTECVLLVCVVVFDIFDVVFGERVVN